MADESSPEIVFKVTGDTKPAEKQVDDLIDKVEKKTVKSPLDKMFDNFGASVIVANQGIELVKKGIEGLKKAMDFAKEGEEIRAIGTRFELIAKQAGLVPERLEAGMAKAVAGTIDMEDAMKAATQAIVSLDKNGERIPQMFEIARKASMLFGGEVTDRFNQMAQAAASGATKSLKDIGIIIKSEEAYKRYADVLKMSVADLSDAQKQQAILNEILEKGAKQYKNINDSITPIDESSKRAKVAVGELGDTIALVFDKFLGKTARNSIDTLALSFDGLRKGIEQAFLGSKKTVEDEMKSLTKELSRLNEMQVLNPGSADQFAPRIAEISARMQELSKEQQSTAETAAIAGAASDSMKGKFDAQKTSVDGLNASLTQLKAQMEQDYIETLRKAQGEWEVAAPTFDNFVTGFKQGVKEMAGTMRSLGKQVSGTFVTGFSNAFAAMGAALINGQDMFGAFGKAILSMLGAVAIQMGMFFIASGIGFLWLDPARGAGLIAAGIGLSLVGGILQALGGGGVGSGAAASAGSGATPTVAVDPMMTETPEKERAKANTGVVINVQGNILDRRSTGLELAEILNENFDTNGVTVRAMSGVV